MSSGALPLSRAAWTGPSAIGPLRLTGANAVVRFAVSFMRVLTVRGTFPEVEGILTFDGRRPDDATIEARIAVASIRSGNRLRDAHLCSRGWFNARRYPFIELRARGAEHRGQRLRLVGTVTIKGREGPVTIDCDSSNGAAGAELTGRLVISRTTFGVGPPPIRVARWDPRAYFVDQDVFVELGLRLDGEGAGT